MRWLCVLIGIANCCAAAASQPRPAVLELFTSEGCSSCPPAEAYVGELTQRQDVLALTFHVGYWDDLGWRDRYALKAATQRQSQYASVLHKASVYTPQAVIDGREDHVGSNQASIARSLSSRRSGTPVSLTVVDGDIHVAVGAQRAAPQSEVMLVGYLRKAITAIDRGENAGRKIEEFNIVRSIERLGLWSGAAQDFRLAASSLPHDVTDVAVLVQSKGQGPIVGAASKAIH